MGKKIWYSTPLNYYWGEIYATQKKYTPEFSDEKIFNVLRHRMINAPFKQDETSDQRGLLISGLELWREDLRGKFLHVFFLDKILQDFLEETPLTDLEGIRKYLYQEGKNVDVVYFNTDTKVNNVLYTFGLHIPYEKDGYAFSLSLFDDNTIELYYCRGQYSGRVSDKFYNNMNKGKDKMSVELSKVFRLAINTIAYMKCFPECVSEGVPKITKERDEIRSKQNVILQMSDKIMDFENPQRSRTPHFRRGHFRLLQSEYYVNKKGQIVYIPETMVKGKANTVSTSEKIEEFGDRAEKENQHN